MFYNLENRSHYVGNNTSSNRYRAYRKEMLFPGFSRHSYISIYVIMNLYSRAEQAGGECVARGLLCSASIIYVKVLYHNKYVNPR